LRFRLFGWNVRFTHGLLAKDRPRDPRSGAANSRANHQVYGGA
jgi:hypothetical protein